MKRVLLKKKILKKNSKYGLHTPPPPFWFLLFEPKFSHFFQD
jgi:hypothetical protein